MWRERGESGVWGEGSCSLSGTRTRCGWAAAAQRICQQDPPPGAGDGARRGSAGRVSLTGGGGRAPPPPLPNRAVFYGSFPGPLRLSSRDKKLKVGGKLRTRSSGCLPADVRTVPSAGPSRVYCRLWCQSMRCPSNVSFSTPPSGSARLGLGRGSTDRVWLFQFGQDGAGAGFWGFSGLLGKMLDFRFLLGIFVICSHGVVLSWGGGRGCVLGWDERWGFDLAISFSESHFSEKTFSFSSLWNVSQGKRQSLKLYWCFPPEKFLPEELNGNFAIPTFSWELSWLWGGRKRAICLSL